MANREVEASVHSVVGRSLQAHSSGKESGLRHTENCFPSLGKQDLSLSGDCVSQGPWALLTHPSLQVAAFFLKTVSH